MKTAEAVRFLSGFWATVSLLMGGLRIAGQTNHVPSQVMWITLGCVLAVVVVWATLEESA